MSSPEPNLPVDSAEVEPLAPLEPSALRKQLPVDLKTWRGPSGRDKTIEPVEALWKVLAPFFAERGYTLWEHQYWFMTAVSPDEVVQNGYMHVTPYRAFKDLETASGSVQGALTYQYRNALTRAARAADGRDVVLRVLAIGKEGQEHVELLKEYARGPMSLLSVNHMLPLLDLIELEDITFAVFPKVGYSCSDMYNTWAHPSVGDVLDMIAQCLEDAFKDNFLIQWYPESLDYAYAPPSRPRVYMNDFELAIMFPSEMPAEERVCVGRPSGGSLPGASGRPMPPEVLSGEPYNPFKMDVWHFGKSIEDFKSTIPEIDAVLVSLTDPDPATRPTTYEAMKAFLNAIDAILPKSLKMKPEVAPRTPVVLSSGFFAKADALQLDANSSLAEPAIANE